MRAGAAVAFFRRMFGDAADLPPRILLIDDFPPDAVIGAGSPRAVELLRALSAAGAAVTHFATLTRPDGQPFIDPQLPNVVFVARDKCGLGALALFLDANSDRFDAIIVSRRHNLIAFNAILSRNRRIAASTMIIFDAEAIFAVREDMQRRVLSLPTENAEFTVEQEIELARCAQMVIAVSELEAAQFRTAGYGDVRVLGHAVDPKFDVRPHIERSDILFVGPAYDDDTPNSDAIVWFVDEVLPQLRLSLGPGLALSHVGTSAAPAVLARADGRIDLRGRRPDLAAEFARARVFVAPIRFASGIPLKICEAASRGVPCVVTPVMARQLGWQHERELLVAETPEEFARQCVRLFQDAALWEQIRRHAFARVMQEYDRPGFDLTVAEICARVKASRRRAPWSLARIRAKSWLALRPWLAYLLPQGQR